MMNSNTPMMDNDFEIQNLVDDFRQDCSMFYNHQCETRDQQDADMLMRCSSSSSNASTEGIFRDLPDTNHTPIEYSNDTIALSPAWSFESLLDREDESDHFKPMDHYNSSTATSTPSSPQPTRVYLTTAGASPLNSVNRISDFDMNSGIIQRLNF